MDLVVKIVNFIQSRGLNHRQFKSFLVDMDSEYGELLYHTEVRWLSCKKILKHFSALRNEITLFMERKNKPVPLLADSTFQCNLAFLTDIVQHLNELNLKLQGKKQIITQMYDHIKLFKVELGLWIKQLDEGNSVHFLNLKSTEKVESKCLKIYVDLLSNLYHQFECTFQILKDYSHNFNFFQHNLL